MKQIFSFIFSLFVFVTANSQQFISKGKIEFERKINLHKQLDADGEFTEQFKKMIPQYNVAYFDFIFEGDRSIYKPGKEAPGPRNNFMLMPASENVVYNNYADQKFTSSKQVFENSYLVQDSMGGIKWKITSETRMIAGFNCRRAETVILDSVYIIAFYTDEIMATGGPENFSGLPGMILGIVMPRANTTWFATKLELAEVKESDFKIPAKGKKTTITGLKSDLSGLVKRWGKYAHRYMWMVMI